MTIYTVQPDDTVDSIAAANGVSSDSIIYINQIPYPYRLAVGQALLLESANPLVSEQRAAYIGGYAYPFISRFVLNETLPYLSYLYVFSYGFTAEGELVPPILDDGFMIEAAAQFTAEPVLTLTPFGADGNFNNNLISAVVNDTEARERLKDNIIAAVQEKGFYGVDIDFEYIKAEDRDAFTDFVRYITEAVHSLGYPVSVALAPKTSAAQRGLLYEGKDYAALGAIADYVLLMTYEWGYKYGPPMAVAPINKVREVLDYAVSVIPPEKIHLGIPNYGYDWTLPYVRGGQGAVTLGSVEAVQLAVENNVEILYDETAMAPYFYYSKDGENHEVWFEDIRSVRAKFNLILEYRLRGAGYWTVMNLFRANWYLLAEYFDVLIP
ncbi:MAG: LysM peptidoglycan-binding domain-containing protein [Butyrivibrio sp.]|nr:LysM peptidoglycan-binding domain-containing protein [Butyrivibrio sp.]